MTQIQQAALLIIAAVLIGPQPSLAADITIPRRNVERLAIALGYTEAGIHRCGEISLNWPLRDALFELVGPARWNRDDLDEIWRKGVGEAETAIATDVGAYCISLMERFGRNGSGWPKGLVIPAEN